MNEAATNEIQTTLNCAEKESEFRDVLDGGTDCSGDKFRLEMWSTVCRILDQPQRCRYLNAAHEPKCFLLEYKSHTRQAILFRWQHISFYFNYYFSFSSAVLGIQTA